MSENMYDAWDNGDRHEIRQRLANKKPISDDDDTQVYRSELEAAVKLAVSAERRAIIKIAEDELKRVKPIYSVIAENILHMIREREEKA